MQIKCKPPYDGGGSGGCWSRGMWQELGEELLGPEEEALPAGCTSLYGVQPRKPVNAQTSFVLSDHYDDDDD